MIDIHLILIDDGSTDGSMDLCVSIFERISPKLFHLACNLCNIGRAASRNIGVTIAQSLKVDFVTFLDQDDWLPEESLSTRLQHVGRHTLVYGLQEFKLLSEYKPGWVRPEWLETPQPGTVLGASIFPLSLFNIMGLFDESLTLGTDDLMWFAKARRLKLREFCINKVVLYRGVHDQNSSQNPNISRELLSVVRSHSSNDSTDSRKPADVAVIITVFNETRYLLQAIESAMSQSLQAAKIIIIDDGSDAPVKLPASLSMNDQLVFSRLDKNMGLAFARNYAFDLLDDDIEWIAFLDADDLWPVDRLVLLRNAAVNGVDAVFGMMSTINSEGQQLDSLLHQTRLPNAGIISRKAFSLLNGFDNSIKLGQPIEFMIRFDELSLVSLYVPFLTLLRRVHSSNMTRDRAALAADYLSIVRNHLVNKVRPRLP
jgi:glycosyltransferase involved in cell wall biosynthesis